MDVPQSIIDIMPLDENFLFALQVPSFRHWILSSQVKSGHNTPTNATQPGQGVSEKFGLPLNTYVQESSSIICSNYKGSLPGEKWHLPNFAFAKYLLSTIFWIIISILFTNIITVCILANYEHFIPFSFFVNDEKRKNQLYCLCLKMTADFGNFVAKNDEKRKTKDEMNPALVTLAETFYGILNSTVVYLSVESYTSY